MGKFRIPDKQAGAVMAEKERLYFEKSGYWLCLGCKAPCAEVANLGEHNQHCAKCKSVLQWIPPKKTEDEERRTQSSKILSQKTRVEDDRLNETLSSGAAKASLTEAAFKGFYTCTSCGHIVQVKDGKCAQCGSDKVIFNKPVLGAEIVESKKGPEGNEGSKEREAA